MGTVDLPNKTSAPRRERPGFDAAVPSRGDAARRGDRGAAAPVLEEETDRVVRHLEAVLASASSGEKPLSPSVKKGLREKLYAYVERNYRGLLERLPAEAGDETDGSGSPVRRTPEEIGGLLDSMGGADRFNTGEIEKTTTVRPWDSPEDAPGRKTDAAAFVRGENACRVLGCVFGDNAFRPKTVTDAKLRLNVPEDDLVPPAFRCRVAASHLIGEIVCGYLVKVISREAAAGSGEGLSGEELARRVLERCTETAAPAPEPQDTVRNIVASAAMANVRRRGFDAAAGLLVSVLTDGGLGFQFMENRAGANGYDFAIREYDDTDAAALPDERYAVRLRYFDRAGLAAERRAYDEALESLDGRLRHFLDLLEVIYRDSKSVFNVSDFDDFARRNGNRMRKMRKTGAGLWNGGAGDASGSDEKACGCAGMGLRLAQIRERLATVRKHLTPVERRVSDERLALLESDFAQIENAADPHRIRPGLLVDVELSTVKRKKTTLNAVSAALGEFLSRLPSGFAGSGE